MSQIDNEVYAIKILIEEAYRRLHAATMSEPTRQQQVGLGHLTVSLAQSREQVNELLKLPKEKMHVNQK